MAFSEEDFGITSEHNFFATSHDKGAVDAIGGTVKRMMKDRISSCPGFSISTAEEFVRETQSRTDKIKIILVTTEEIERQKIILTRRWKNLRNFTGIRSCHSTKSIGNQQIEGTTTCEHNEGHIWNIY